jgi:hypothetical protein
LGVRCEWEALGVPPREIASRGLKLEGRIGDGVFVSQELDVGVIDVDMSRCVPGILPSSVDADISSVAGIEEASSIRVLLLTTLMDETSGSVLSGEVDVDGGVYVVDTAATGRSSPVAAANLICIDSGTLPVLTQGRTVNCLLGRSRTKDQLKHRLEG